MTIGKIILERYRIQTRYNLEDRYLSRSTKLYNSTFTGNLLVHLHLGVRPQVRSPNHQSLYFTWKKRWKTKKFFFRNSSILNVRYFERVRFTCWVVQNHLNVFMVLVLTFDSFLWLGCLWLMTPLIVNRCTWPKPGDFLVQMFKRLYEEDPPPRIKGKGSHTSSDCLTPFPLHLRIITSLDRL